MKSILICHPGRCGSHWLLYMLQRVTGLERPGDDLTEKPVEDGWIWGTRSHVGILKQLQRRLDIVFLLRDPRDVIVSMQLYDLHVQNGFGTGGDIELATRQVMAWYWWYLDVHRAVQHTTVRYEHLWTDPVDALDWLLFGLHGEWSNPAAKAAAIQSQSFETCTGRTRGQEDVTNHLRKGIVGDWRNHWDEAQARAFWGQHGKVMEELEYADRLL